MHLQGLDQSTDCSFAELADRQVNCLYQGGVAPQNFVNTDTGVPVATTRDRRAGP